jgi:hypothetical protein
MIANRVARPPHPHSPTKNVTCPLPNYCKHAVGVCDDGDETRGAADGVDWRGAAGDGAAGAGACDMCTLMGRGSWSGGIAHLRFSVFEYVQNQRIEYVFLLARRVW